MINVLMPMAGEGKRFVDAGYKNPKPFIEVNGVPLFIMALEHINIECNQIFIVKTDHKKYMENVKLKNKNSVKIVYQNKKLNGAVESCLLAKDIIDNDSPLIIVDSDQYAKFNINNALNYFNDYDAGVITFKSNLPIYSYLKSDNGYVVDIEEKKVISDDAVAGIYFWKTGSDFIKYSKNIIDNKKTINGEYYVSSTIKEAIFDNRIVGMLKADSMQTFGTPEDLENFVKTH